MRAFNMIEPRTTYWIAADDCRAARDALTTFISEQTMMPFTLRSLQAVLTELEVAEVRDAAFPESTKIARLVVGRTADSLPIFVSEAEREALIGVPGLPRRVHEQLTHGDASEATRALPGRGPEPAAPLG